MLELVKTIEIQDPNIFGAAVGLLEPTKTVLHLWADRTVTWQEVKR